MSTFGNKLRITIFGESHGPAIGVTIDGFPAGFEIDTDELSSFMSRRAPGKNEFSTQRKEDDEVIFLSGVIGNKTTGATICAIIKNTNQHSEDYKHIDIPRPSHSDYAAYVKFNGNNDIRGGGDFSGRLTAPLCIAGSLCLQYLKKTGIYIGAHISSIKEIYDDLFNKTDVSLADFVDSKEFPVINDDKGKVMQEQILKAKDAKDSVGGTIECAIIGVPAGLGGSLFDGIESKISSCVFGIPAVKGIEFGSGFDGSKLYGLENNDPFFYDNGVIKTKTNNHGGILGGISSSMPIIFNVAIKPTPSIGIEQDSVSILNKNNTKLTIEGRHDPCIVQRAVPCIEAAAAICVCDLLF